MEYKIDINIIKNIYPQHISYMYIYINIYKYIYIIYIYIYILLYNYNILILGFLISNINIFIL